MAIPNGRPPASQSRRSLKMRTEPPGSVREKAGATPPASAAWPILSGKDPAAPSVFRPEALLREARRQKRLPLTAVPRVCVLDPDGDIVRHLKRTGAARAHKGWACYHTDLLTFDLDSAGEVGIIGCAVASPIGCCVAFWKYVNAGEGLTSKQYHSFAGVRLRSIPATWSCVARAA